MTGNPGDYHYAVDTTLSVPATRIVAVHGTRGGETAPAQRLRLGEALVAAGVITPGQLDACLRRQEETTPRRRLGGLVVELGLATDVQVAQGLATILGFEYVDPGETEVPLDVVRTVPRLTAEMLGVVPIGAGPTWLRVAVADPTDRYMLEALREATGLMNVSFAVATPRAIDAALNRFWAHDYAPAAAPVRIAAVPDPEPEPEEPEAGPEAVSGEPWEYAFVGDGMPSTHPGHTPDVRAMERELARLGDLGWEAVSMTASGTRMVVLLKRRRP
ncbi:MAG TPA: hypothetical protein VGX28_15780 [Frankiaceae bacterium]|jgi:hypothetical protein|nr:hypothetical protein [Frankiaceae bacterium]